MYAMQIQTGELRETDLPAGYGEWSRLRQVRRDVCTTG